MQISGNIETAANKADLALFRKYRENGSYHWTVLSANPFRKNIIHLGRYQVTKSLLEEALYGIQGKSVLDLGCGDGVLSYHIARSGGFVSGVDLCEYAIEYAKKQTAQRGISINFSVQDACATAFLTSSFDAVVSNEVIEHLDEPERLLREIERVLKPGGIAVISTPIRVTKKPLDPHHAHEWFQEDFQELVSATFQDVRHRASHPLALTDMWYRSGFARRAIQIASIFSNPMCSETSIGLHRQQYAVIRKSRS